MKTQTNSLARLLLIRFQWMDKSLLKSLKNRGQHELTRAQSLIMSQVGDNKVRISEIARQIGVSRQAAQKTVVSLEQLDLVMTVADPENSSAKLVTLTSAGLENTVAATRILTLLEARLKQRIGASEVSALRVALEADWGKSVEMPPDD